MKEITLTIDQWIDRVENALRSADHARVWEVQNMLACSDGRSKLFPTIYRRGVQAFSLGDYAVAEGLLAWLEKMDQGNWCAHLAHAEVKQKTQGTEIASRDFAAFVREYPAFPYQSSKSTAPTRCAVLLSTGKGLVHFKGGGFTLPAGLTESQHLIQNENYSAVMLFGEGLQDTTLNDFDVVINAVSDADLHGALLRHFQQVLERCRIPVVNRPESLLGNTRDRLSSMIPSNDRLIVPRTIRLELKGERPGEVADQIAKHDLNYPILIRPTGTQTGEGLTKLDSSKDAQRGVAMGSYYLTEFHDFQSPDGYYRKYRCWEIGGQMVPNHLFFGDSWNVHGSSRFKIMTNNPNMLKEEKAFVEGYSSCNFKHVGLMMDAVRQATHLDYFGVDFGITPDGAPILFEANPTMRSAYPEFLDAFPYTRDVQKRHVKTFQAMIEQKIHATSLETLPFFAAG